MHGADSLALRRLARSLAARGHDIDATRRRLGVVVEAMPWIGPDRDRFVEEWRRSHGPALATIAADLAEASDEAVDHARRQEQASAADR